MCVNDPVLVYLTMCMEPYYIFLYTHTYLSAYLVEGSGVVVSRRASIDKIFSFGAAASSGWCSCLGGFWGLDLSPGSFAFFAGMTRGSRVPLSPRSSRRRRRLREERRRRRTKERTENGGVIRTLGGLVVSVSSKLLR